MMDRGTVRNMQSFIPKQIWEISASGWFYYKDLSRCTVTWTSNSCNKSFRLTYKISGNLHLRYPSLNSGMNINYSASAISTRQKFSPKNTTTTSRSVETQGNNPQRFSLLPQNTPVFSHTALTTSCFARLCIIWTEIHNADWRFGETFALICNVFIYGLLSTFI
jgi:hypothetical protein